MIVAFSTSSPQSSVALMSMDALLWSGRQEAPQAASGACLRLLKEGLSNLGASLTDAEMFVADLGPGSFTGVRVGVTLAKTLALTQGAMAAGGDAFDLIDSKGDVVLPSKRGEWFVRRIGHPPERCSSLPQGNWKGFGPGLGAQTYPDAARFLDMTTSLMPVQPELLVPLYLMDPSISLPKKAYGASVAR